MHTYRNLFRRGFEMDVWNKLGKTAQLLLPNMSKAWTVKPTIPKKDEGKKLTKQTRMTLHALAKKRKGRTVHWYTRRCHLYKTKKYKTKYNKVRKVVQLEYRCKACIYCNAQRARDQRAEASVLYITPRHQGWTHPNRQIAWVTREIMQTCMRYCVEAGQGCWRTAPRLKMVCICSVSTGPSSETFYMNSSILNPKNPNWPARVNIRTCWC